MLTEKVLFCIVMIPTIWLTYGVLLYFFTNLDGPAVALSILSMPLFAYMGMVVAEAGMVDWKDLRPYTMRVFPSTRKRLAALPETQKGLQKDLRGKCLLETTEFLDRRPAPHYFPLSWSHTEFIKKIGPALGEIYYGKDVNWATIRETSALGKKTK